MYGLHDIQVCEESVDITEELTLTYDGGLGGYAHGKWAAERLALSGSAAGRTLVIRPFNVVGPGQTGKYGMVLPRFVDAALRSRTLTIYNDGEQQRSFSHIDTF